MRVVQSIFQRAFQIRPERPDRIGTHHACQLSEIDDRLSPGRRLDLVVSADFPLARMIDGSGPHHVEIDVCHAAEQVTAGLHCRCVIPVFPKCAFSILSPVELLSGAARDQLHCTRYLCLPFVEAKQVYVVRRCNVVEDGQAISPFRLEQPVPPASPVARKSQKELLLMATVSEMPHISGTRDSVGSGHGTNRADSCAKTGVLTPNTAPIPAE